MRSLTIKRSEAERLGLRAELWKNTGADPALIEATVSEICRSLRNTRQALRNGPNPLRRFGRQHQIEVKYFREETICWLASKYAKKHLRNVGLCGPAFVQAMNKKVGTERFSVEIIEDIVRKLAVEKQKILVGEFMLNAQQMLPRRAKAKQQTGMRKRIVHGNTLILNHPHDIDTYSNTPCVRVVDFAELIPLGALDKLSRVLLRHADPANIKESIAEQTPYRIECGKPIEYHGSPIYAAIFDDTKVTIIYETREDARRVAEVLVKRAPSPDQSLKTFLPRFLSCRWTGTEYCQNGCKRRSHLAHFK